MSFFKKIKESEKNYTHLQYHNYHLKSTALWKKLGKPIFFSIDPETVHHLVVKILKIFKPIFRFNNFRYHFNYNSKPDKRLEKEVFGNKNIPTRSEVMENLIPYIQEETSKGTQLNHIMRHTVGLFHGQNGSKVWKQYLSKNMCIRDANLQKVNHIMDQVKKTNPISLER